MQGGGSWKKHVEELECGIVPRCRGMVVKNGWSLLEKVVCFYMSKQCSNVILWQTCWYFTITFYFRIVINEPVKIGKWPIVWKVFFFSRDMSWPDSSIPSKMTKFLCTAFKLRYSQRCTHFENSPCRTREQSNISIGFVSWHFVLCHKPFYDHFSVIKYCIL